MSNHTDKVHLYTMREVAKLSGLPESTLRYYETLGIIHPIRRDSSSKHRAYSEDEVHFALAIACLNATGMSLVNWLNVRTQMLDRGALVRTFAPIFLTRRFGRISMFLDVS